MPEVKMAVSFLFPEAPVHDSADYLRSMRPCDDMTLDDLANLRFDAAPPAPPASMVDPNVPVMEHVGNIRVDVGWLVKAKYDDKEVELETSLILFNEVGEEVGQVNAGDSTDGIQMLGAEPVPDDEEEVEAEEEEEEDAPKKPKLPKVFSPETTSFPVKERIAINVRPSPPSRSTSRLGGANRILSKGLHGATEHGL